MSKTILLKDEAAIPHAPVPKEITKKEYAKLYPEKAELAIKLVYIFRVDKLVEVPEEVATVLLQKYDTLRPVLKDGVTVEHNDNFDSLNFMKLRKLAQEEYGIPWGETEGLKKPEIIQKVREAKASNSHDTAELVR